jgi:integrase
MGIKDLGNGKYRIDLRIGGRRGSRHRATISATRDEARQAYADLRKATQAGGSGATLRDAYVHATVHRYHERKDRAGVEDRWRVLTQLLDENMQLSALDTRAITQLLTDLRTRAFKGRTLTASTINKHLSLLRTILKEGSRAKPALIEPDDLPYIPHLKERQAKRRPLKEDEERNVLAWLELVALADPAKWGEFYDFIVFQLNAGTRRGEALKIERGDVNLAAGKYGRIRIRDPKNGSEREVPLTATTRLLVERRLPAGHRDRLFPRLTKALVQNRWSDLRTTLDLEDVCIHSLRHTAGKRIVDLTGNLRAAQVVLGHKRVSTTERYTAVDGAALDRVAEALSAGGSSAPTNPQPDASLNPLPDVNQKVTS